MSYNIVLYRSDPGVTQFSVVPKFHSTLRIFTFQTHQLLGENLLIILSQKPDCHSSRRAQAYQPWTFPPSTVNLLLLLGAEVGQDRWSCPGEPRAWQQGTSPKRGGVTQSHLRQECIVHSGCPHLVQTVAHHVRDWWTSLLPQSVKGGL